MDNYFLDDCLTGSRLKTKRKKKQLVKKDFDKQLIQLNKLEDILLKKRRALPLVPLAIPYQKGWERYFKLREDVAKSNEAHFYKLLLEKINTLQYSSEKSFKKRKRRKGKDEYFEKLQTVREFTISEWLSPELGFTDREKMYFHKIERWCSNCKCYKIYYVFNEPWRFVLRIRPNMITHTKMIDADLESQIAQLQNSISSHFLRYRINKIVFGWVNYKNGWMKTKVSKHQNPLTNKSTCALLYEYYEEKNI